MEDVKEVETKEDGVTKKWENFLEELGGIEEVQGRKYSKPLWCMFASITLDKLRPDSIHYNDKIREFNKNYYTFFQEFPKNMFRDEYAIMYAVKKKQRIISLSELDEIIQENKDIILKSPYIDMEGETEEEKIENLDKVVKDLIWELSNRYVTNEDLISNIVEYKKMIGIDIEKQAKEEEDWIKYRVQQCYADSPEEEGIVMQRMFKGILKFESVREQFSRRLERNDFSGEWYLVALMLEQYQEWMSPQTFMRTHPKEVEILKKTYKDIEERFLEACNALNISLSEGEAEQLVMNYESKVKEEARKKGFIRQKEYNPDVIMISRDSQEEVNKEIKGKMEKIIDTKETE